MWRISPGYPQGIGGPELMEDLRKQAERFGADLRYGVATAANLAETPYKITIDDEKMIEAETLIIATGGRTVEWTRDEIRKAKDLTAKPFGVNIMLMAPNIAEIIDVVCEEKVAFVTFGRWQYCSSYQKNFIAAEIKSYSCSSKCQIGKAC